VNTNDSSAWQLALARILIAGTYFFGGFALFGGDLPIGYAASKGIPAFAVYLAFAIKLVAGFGVIVGFQTRLSALLLLGFTVATAFLFHWPSAEDPFTFGKEMTMIGGLLLLMVTGAGNLSIDARLAKSSV
jgi:putative oxidoreductase